MKSAVEVKALQQALNDFGVELLNPPPPSTNCFFNSNHSSTKLVQTQKMVSWINLLANVSDDGAVHRGAIQLTKAYLNYNHEDCSSTQLLEKINLLIEQFNLSNDGADIYKLAQFCETNQVTTPEVLRQYFPTSILQVS
jgi:hypothetical protein